MFNAGKRIVSAIFKIITFPRSTRSSQVLELKVPNVQAVDSIMLVTYVYPC